MNESRSDAYYAAMASVILPVSILFAGCRLGALLDIRLGAVQFLSIESGEQPQKVVALFPGGSKTDPLNQRTSPIMFGELPDKTICPYEAFSNWLTIRGTSKIGEKLEGNPSNFLFPLYSTNKKVQTGHFTRLVKKWEEKYSGKLPKYKAHVGRFTITTLSMFAKDENGEGKINPLTLEHQMSWTRNTKVLPNYMGHNSVCAKGGFFDTISEIRRSGLEKSINEDAVKIFTAKKLNDNVSDVVEK